MFMFSSSKGDGGVTLLHDKEIGEKRAPCYSNCNLVKYALACSICPLSATIPQHPCSNPKTLLVIFLHVVVGAICAFRSHFTNVSISYIPYLLGHSFIYIVNM